jgi:hypothetical protein
MIYVCLKENPVNSELRALLKYQRLPFNPQEDHAKAEKFFPLVPSSSLLPLFSLF